MRVFAHYPAFVCFDFGCKKANKERVQSDFVQGVHIASLKSCLPCQNYIVTVRKNLHNSDSLAHKPAQYTTAVLPRT